MPLALIVIILSCSSQKNTALYRRVQAIKADYNTYFNGKQAFIEGYQAQRDGNKDNYMELLPYYIVGNSSTLKLGSGMYDRAIEKSKKKNS